MNGLDKFDTIRIFFFIRSLHKPDFSCTSRAEIKNHFPVELLYLHIFQVVHSLVLCVVIRRSSCCSFCSNVTLFDLVSVAIPLNLSYRKICMLANLPSVQLREVVWFGDQYSPNTRILVPGPCTCHQCIHVVILDMMLQVFETAIENMIDIRSKIVQIPSRDSIKVFTSLWTDYHTFYAYNILASIEPLTCLECS